MAFARMEATDVNQVVTVRALAIGFRLGAQGSDIEGIVDGFQLCRAQGKLFHQISPHRVGNRHHVATLINSLNFLLLHPAVKAGAMSEIGGRKRRRCRQNQTLRSRSARLRATMRSVLCRLESTRSNCPAVRPARLRRPAGGRGGTARSACATVYGSDRQLPGSRAPRAMGTPQTSRSEMSDTRSPSRRNCAARVRTTFSAPPPGKPINHK